MLPDTLLNLPAHALLVHAAVVLVPLGALALVVIGWKADWRRSYSLPAGLIAVAGAGFAFLAQQSGGPLKRAIRDAADRSGQRAAFGDHPQQGNTALIFAGVLALAAVAFWLIERFGQRYGLPTWTPRAAYGVVVVAALLATATMLLAGHSGATLVWKDLGTYTGSR